MSYYLYKFYNKDNELLYLGKTKNIKERFNTHRATQTWWDEVTKIEYAKLSSGLEMSIYELYLINLLKPKYNKVDVYDEEIKITFPDIDFKNYDASKVNIKKEMKSITKNTSRRRFYSFMSKITLNKTISVEDIISFSIKNPTSSEWEDFLDGIWFGYNDTGLILTLYSCEDTFSQYSCYELIFMSGNHLGGRWSLSIDDFLNKLRNKFLIPVDKFKQSHIDYLIKEDKEEYGDYQGYELIDDYTYCIYGG